MAWKRDAVGAFVLFVVTKVWVPGALPCNDFTHYA